MRIIFLDKSAGSSHLWALRPVRIQWKCSPRSDRRGCWSERGSGGRRDDRWNWSKFHKMRTMLFLIEVVFLFLWSMINIYLFELKVTVFSFSHSLHLAVRKKVLRFTSVFNIIAEWQSPGSTGLTYTNKWPFLLTELQQDQNYSVSYKSWLLTGISSSLAMQSRVWLKAIFLVILLVHFPQNHGPWTFYPWVWVTQTLWPQLPVTLAA